ILRWGRSPTCPGKKGGSATCPEIIVSLGKNRAPTTSRTRRCRCARTLDLGGRRWDCPFSPGLVFPGGGNALLAPRRWSGHRLALVVRLADSPPPGARSAPGPLVDPCPFRRDDHSRRYAAAYPTHCFILVALSSSRARLTLARRSALRHDLLDPRP